MWRRYPRVHSDLTSHLASAVYPAGELSKYTAPNPPVKLLLHCIAEAQKKGGDAAFIDVEHALDPVYASALGVDIDNLLVSQPDNGEQALAITEELVRSGAIDVIVVDSVAALVPRAEVEGDMGSTFVGLQARLMSQALRKLTSAIGKSNCIAIFINQLREKVGVVYGNPEVTPGGRALKFYSSVRIEIRKGEVLKSGSDIIGARTKAKVVKNKIAPPFRTTEFDVMYGEGISHNGELLDLAVELGIVKKGGAWFSYGETRLGQGRDNAKNYFVEHPEVAEEIEAQVRANADKLLNSKKPAKAAAKKKENDDGSEGTQASVEAVPIDNMVDDIPIPDEFLDDVQPEKPKKNIDISVD